MKATSSPLLKTDAIRFLHPPQNVSSLVQKKLKIKIHSFRFSTWAHFWNTAHAAIHSSPTQCFLKMNYVLASKQNGHRVICAQCHGLRLTEQSWGWKSDVGCFRRCYGACFGNCSCPDILTKIFIGLLASEGSFLDLCVREETFQREVSKVSLIIKHLLTWKYRKAPGDFRNRCKTTAQANKVGTV